jgi:hypothetical protein
VSAVLVFLIYGRMLGLSIAPLPSDCHEKRIQGMIE